MIEKVGDYYQYSTSVTTVKTVLNDWHTIITPVIGVYTTIISQPMTKSWKKSLKRSLKKLFKKH